MWGRGKRLFPSFQAGLVGFQLPSMLCGNPSRTSTMIRVIENDNDDDENVYTRRVRWCL